MGLGACPEGCSQDVSTSSGYQAGSRPSPSFSALCRERKRHRQSSETRTSVLAGEGGGKSPSWEPFPFCLWLPGLSLLVIQMGTPDLVMPQLCRDVL